MFQFVDEVAATPAPKAVVEEEEEEEEEEEVERQITVALIKPDAVAAGKEEEILEKVKHTTKHATNVVL